jgi:hypothetical protein
VSKAVSLLQNSYQHFVRISPPPLKNKRQNSAPDINHHFDMKQSTKRLTIQFSPQFCTATLLGPKFLLSALFSNTLNLSYLRFSPVALRPDAGSWPPLTGLHDNSLDTPHMVGLLRTSDRPYAATSILQRTALTRDKHLCPRWDSHPQSQQTSDRRRTH